MVETVLGVSMAPSTVRIVLVEGENAGGPTVDEEKFAVADSEDPATFRASDQVVAAILGTREGASEAGYELCSTGVTWSDPREAAELRDALAARKVENVMLVSTFLAAAALAQAMGAATGYTRAALLYVEPDAATLAVVDISDGSITEVHREVLPDDDDQAVSTLLDLVAAAERLDDEPEGVLVVGSGVDIPLIRPALQSATSLPLSVPDQPEMALARGAALASANAPLFASSTAAQAYALDPGTGAVGQPGYLAVAEASAAEPGGDALAYSAVADDSAAVYTHIGPDAYAGEDHDFTTGMYPDFAAMEHEPVSRVPFLTAMSVLVIFVAGVMALVISLAFSIRPTASTRPSLSQNVLAPARVVPRAQVPAAAPMQAPAPAPAPAFIPRSAPAPAFVPRPGPAPAFVPRPAPAPAFVPAPIPVLPPLIPNLLPPPIFGPPAGPGPWGGDRGGPWGRGEGPGRGGPPGWGHGGGGWGRGGGGWGHGGHGRW